MVPKFEQLSIDGVIKITPKKISCDNGILIEAYDKEVFAKNGITTNFVQDNSSLSVTKGTLRGLHFQSAPVAQDKLVRVLSGKVFDVVVDIRSHSHTYKKWIGVELSAKNTNILFVPKGLAHGYVTMEDNTEISYKVSEFYEPNHEHSINFEDPSLRISWPFKKEEMILSDRDINAPFFDEMLHLY